jgi:hypothetical protein
MFSRATLLSISSSVLCTSRAAFSACLALASSAAFSYYCAIDATLYWVSAEAYSASNPSNTASWSALSSAASQSSNSALNSSIASEAASLASVAETYSFLTLALSSSFCFLSLASLIFWAAVKASLAAVAALSAAESSCATT